MPRQARLDGPGVMHRVMYKSVVCQEELYFAERVRAIHLNPLRAGIGADGRELNRSPDGGHSAVVGRSRRPWPAPEDVLTSFGKTVAQARKAYGTDVAAGVPPGRRDDRIGGGLIRTLGAQSCEVVLPSCPNDLTLVCCVGSKWTSAAIAVTPRHAFGHHW